MSKPLLVCWLVISLAVFVYSYGFVDFNLTISSHPLLTSFVGWSQDLAMFHRSTSLYVYLALILLLYFAYALTLLHASPKTFPWRPILLIALICSLAYPFLSSDVFKYLFAAKELLVYHANPHAVAPQVFEGDTWLRFMRWIHTPSPYGPVMTALAIPYYLLGLGKFTPSLYLFKLDQIFWYGLSIWLIGKLAPAKKVWAQLIFALNPLVLVEWLINAHNDAPMIALLLLAFYLVKESRRLAGFFALALSVGIKYVTIIFLPFIFVKKTNVRLITYYLLSILLLTPLLYHYSYQYQPWYVTWIIPFAAISGSPIIVSLTIAYSVGAFLRYLPYISTGLWLGSPQQFALLTFGPLALSIIIYIIHALIIRLRSTGSPKPVIMKP